MAQAQAQTLMTGLGRTTFVYIAFAIVVLIAVLLIWTGAADAKDLGQWENTDPETKHWYQNLMRPKPYERDTCCGEADAYYCDTIHVVNKHTTCIITDDRDDVPLGRPHINVGTVIDIPDDKLKWDEGNPTGHSVVFLGGSGAYGYGRPVFCFVQTSGT